MLRNWLFKPLLFQSHGAYKQRRFPVPNYQYILNRLVFEDQSGFNFWVNALDKGPVLYDLIIPFLDAEEYAGRFSYPIQIASWTVRKAQDPFSQKYRIE